MSSRARRAGSRVLLLTCASLLGCNASFRFEDQAEVRASEPSCEQDADCPHDSHHCDVVSHRCVACRDDADCAATGAPRCDAALHRCVECGSNLDCGSGQTCEQTTRRCVIACSEGQGEHACPATAPTCDEVAGFCIQCQGDADCKQNTDDGQYCELANGRCVHCTEDRQCPAAQPRCDRTRGRCDQCIESGDCPAGKVCDLGRMQCV